jgi:hypothetical protein
MESAEGSYRGLRGREYSADLLHKIKVEVIVDHDILERAIDAILDAGYTGKIGDDRIFLYKVERPFASAIDNGDLAALEGIALCSRAIAGPCCAFFLSRRRMLWLFSYLRARAVLPSPASEVREFLRTASVGH